MIFNGWTDEATSRYDDIPIEIKAICSLPFSPKQSWWRHNFFHFWNKQLEKWNKFYCWKIFARTSLKAAFKLIATAQCGKVAFIAARSHTLMSSDETARKSYLWSFDFEGIHDDLLVLRTRLYRFSITGCYEWQQLYIYNPFIQEHVIHIETYRENHRIPDHFPIFVSSAVVWVSLLTRQGSKSFPNKEIEYIFSKIKTFRQLDHVDSLKWV